MRVNGRNDTSIKTDVVYSRIRTETHKKLISIAKKKNMTISEYIRKLIEKAVSPER